MPDTIKEHSDGESTIKIDSLEKYRKYLYIRRGVINSSVEMRPNESIFREENAGVFKKDLGVIDLIAVEWNYL